MADTTFKFYEFFAGGGMARAGLSAPGFECLFANDFDHKKGEVYRTNWGDSVLTTGDVGIVRVSDLPGHPDMVWASFPCQDLSLAGGGAGLKGDRSGTFWPFWKLMQGLVADARAPRLIVLENVCGTLTSHEGADFTSIAEAFASLGYRFGALVIDAALFVPQSRPRLFMIGVRFDVKIPERHLGIAPSKLWHPRSLQNAFDRLSTASKKTWLWWRLAPPPLEIPNLIDIIEEEPAGVSWHTTEQTERLLQMMSQANLAKVERAMKTGHKVVGTIYKRTRLDEDELKIQRAEVRFDGIAGCLRTPAGGSSRQLVLLVDGTTVRSRLISSRETARLMGLPDSYILPSNYNEAYHLTGDGVVVPVVRHLRENILEPILTVDRVRVDRAA